MIFVYIPYIKYSNEWDIVFEWHTWMFMFNTQKSHSFIHNYIVIITQILLKCKIFVLHIKTSQVEKTHNLYWNYIYIVSFSFEA
jgi:hypothetical protein